MMQNTLGKNPFTQAPRSVRRTEQKRKRTRGERVIDFIEGYCLVPEGSKVGQPVRLDPFQKRFILAIYDNPHGTDTAILSIARKNAKTGTIAFIVLAHLVGPEAVQNSRIISGALSREQAAEVYNLASKCVSISPKLQQLVRPVPSNKKLIGLPMNVEYQAISADAGTAHGKSPILAILDEVGQIRGPRSDFVDAITTAQGAYDAPLLIYISTQAANDADLFSILIDDALQNKPPKTVCHVYAADPDAEIMDEEQWRKANPALGTFRSEADMRKQAEKALRMPSSENTFRNLNLNQRVSAHSSAISRDAWLACKTDSRPPLSACTRIVGGLDLSGRTDLTALVLYGYYEGVWYAYPYFWTPEKGLAERAHNDRAPYDVWVTQGFIRTTPGASIRYDFIAYELGEICQGLEIEAIYFDRWRINLLKDELEKIGLEDVIPLAECGQGYKDMSPCIEALDDHILNLTMMHDGNPVLTMCASNATVVRDPSGNRKYDKDKATGRIDGLVALAMAAGGTDKSGGESTTADFDEYLANPVIVR